jgi:probable HAF family extracellular repeat protein
MKTFKKIFLTIVFLFCAGAAWAGDYDIFDIGTFGGDSSRAYGINENGWVTGYAKNAEGYNRAFFWDGSLNDIGTLGGLSAYGNAINDDGDIAGYSSTETSGQTRAFFWDKSASTNKMTNLGVFGGSTSKGSAINNNGWVAGESTYSSSANTYAFIWNGSSMSQLADLGVDKSNAYGMNGNGQVVGKVNSGGGLAQAFLWNNNADPKALIIGTLGGSRGEARGINDNSLVVGTAQNEGENYHAFLWNNAAVEKLKDLGTLYADVGSTAYSINNSGVIVGDSVDESNRSLAFIFQNNQMVDLNEFLPDGSGWILQSAQGINDKGQIVGWGLINGQVHAFILSPNVVPEPISCLLFALGGAALAGARKRRRKS